MKAQLIWLALLLASDGTCKDEFMSEESREKDNATLEQGASGPQHGNNRQPQVGLPRSHINSRLFDTFMVLSLTEKKILPPYFFHRENRFFSPILDSMVRF